MRNSRDTQRGMGMHGSGTLVTSSFNSKMTFLGRSPRRRAGRVFARAVVAAALTWGVGASLVATSIIPISDAGLYLRAQVVVHGVVVSSDVTVDELGRPETLTVIEPLEVLKGALPGSLVLHQLGGVLPDGRFFQMWGKPEYVPGREVIVFAIAHRGGEFETAEMLLGKFEIDEDEKGRLFAVPALAFESHPGVDVHAIPPEYRRTAAGGAPAAEPFATLAEGRAPRLLETFLQAIRSSAFPAEASPAPSGNLTPIEHRSKPSGATPYWGNISNQLWRWNNNATAVWSLEGTANITGGGTAEATGALAAWTNDPNSNINYTLGSGTGDVIHLNATSSALGCGWSSCLAGGGVIGCGGPSGGGSNSWRGETYFTIVGGTVELRSYCTLDLFDSITTQAVLTHELGHTLGLGHSDQNVSPHDVCRGDEDAAQMRSVVQHRTTLGTDDQDAIRWIYGDGLNSCTFTVTGVTPSFGSISGGTVLTIAGNGFVSGATVTVGGVAATGVTVVNGTTIKATTGAHASATVDVVVTIPGPQNATLPASFTYNSGTGFFTLAPCRVLDTRNPTGPLGGPAISAGGNRTFAVASQCGIPAAARAISANVTVTQPSASGDIRAFAASGAMPATSVINYQAGQTRANNALIPLGPGGLSVHCDQPSGTVQLIVDVNGYYQ
jgi:IPT/TIG domain-containing protein